MGADDRTPLSLSGLARDLEDSADVASTMDLAVRLAVREVDGADAAALSVVHRGRRVDTTAASSPSAQHADELQYVVGEGPCLTAVWDDEVVRVPDVRREQRWPRWAEVMAQRSDHRSMLVHRLFTSHDRTGALTLYSTRPDGFHATDLEHAEALAAQIAVAVRSAQRIAGLHVALDSRTVLGQATGMLMERYRIDADRAFALLTRLSSYHHRKLRELALELIETGTLAGLPDPADGPQDDPSS